MIDLSHSARGIAMIFMFNCDHRCDFDRKMIVSSFENVPFESSRIVNMWNEWWSISELRECQLCNVSTTLKLAAEMTSYKKCFLCMLIKWKCLRWLTWWQWAKMTSLGEANSTGVPANQICKQSWVMNLSLYKHCLVVGFQHKMLWCRVLRCDRDNE